MQNEAGNFESGHGSCTSQTKYEEETKYSKIINEHNILYFTKTVLLTCFL